MPTFDLQLGDIHSPEFTLGEIFSYLELSGRPVIIMIDEFQQIAKYPEKNAEALLRSHIQRLRDTTFIFAGSEQTIQKEMFVSSKRPFCNSSEMMYLGPISEEVYVEFAANLFKERDRELDVEAVRMVFDLFDGNTFYLQRTMNGAYADTPEGGVCTRATAVRSVKAMLAASEMIYREILSNVSVGPKATLYAIAKNRMVKSPTSGGFIKDNSLPSPSSVQSALQKLLKSGLVVKSAEGYSVGDPLLRIFINQLYFIPEI